MLRGALAAVACLAALSVVGAFLGAERAKALFNSPPLAAFWLLLLVLTAAAILMSGRIRRRPGSLAMHLGVVLVLVGGVWGSEARHELSSRLTGRARIPAGLLVVPEGERSREILDTSGERVIGELPFELELRDFRIERYPLGDPRWHLVAEVPAAGDEPQLLEWEIGRELQVRGTDVRVKVLQYLEAARPVYREGTGETPLLTKPDGAVSDPESDVPAIRLSLRRAGAGSAEAWLVPRPGRDLAVLWVRDVLGPDERGSADAVWFWLVRPLSPVKSYQSEVVVWENGREAARHVIEVNRPLHYGGYYLYQQSFDPAEGRYTVLRVTSDSGLWWVFAGFGMLCAGAFWRFWGRPATRFLRKGDADGG